MNTMNGYKKRYDWRRKRRGKGKIQVTQLRIELYLFKVLAAPAV